MGCHGDPTRTGLALLGLSTRNAASLLRSLEPDDGDELTGEPCDEIWAAEIDRRLREVRGGAS
jgi:hypothetical protein